MIISAFIFIISLFVGLIAFLLPDFQVLPDIFFEATENFVLWALELNSIFLIVDNLFLAGVFFLKFLNYFLIYKLAVKILNYFRGAEGL